MNSAASILKLSGLGFLSLVLCPIAPAQAVLHAPGGDVGTISGSNVGVGTSSPSYKLHSKATGGSSVALAVETDQTQAYLSLKASGTGSLTSVRIGVEDENLLFLNNGAAERMRINGSGHVGIGTTSPASRLHVYGGYLMVSTSGTNTAFVEGGGSEAYFGNTGTGRTSIGNSENWQTLVVDNGSVGIGTINTGSYKLAVEGHIRARKVVVDQATWPDYVFAADYRLAPLSEVEAHIRDKKHLPGIPSAAEVEQGGVSLGDMQASLLAKIEELTLHQIAQEKRIRALEQENARLQQQPQR